MSFEIDVYLGEGDRQVRIVVGHCDQGRPAPMCFNHDSPAFSDPGDPAECEYEAYYVYTSKEGKEKLRALPYSVVEKYDDYICDQIFEEAAELEADARAEAQIAAYEDRMDRCY